MNDQYRLPTLHPATFLHRPIPRHVVWCGIVLLLLMLAFVIGYGLAAYQHYSRSVIETTIVNESDAALLDARIDYGNQRSYVLEAIEAGERVGVVIPVKRGDEVELTFSFVTPDGEVKKLPNYRYVYSQWYDRVRLVVDASFDITIESP